MSEKNHDVIVLGLGGMGSAAAYHLSKRGQKVLGLDTYPRGHSNGSSHGRTRIIRQAHWETPEYVPLLRRAYALWRDLEKESNRTLLSLYGSLLVGTPEHAAAVEEVTEAARLHNLEHEQLAPEDLARRFPGFRFREDVLAVYEATAGNVDPQDCGFAHLDLATEHGAELRHGEAVRGWEADESGARVWTTDGVYDAGRLVVAAGAWTGEILADLRLPLTVLRKVVVHFESERPEPFLQERCPAYILRVPEGNFYGFPYTPGHGLKVGRHDGGEECTPRTVRRKVEAEDVDELRRVLDRYMPGAAGEVRSAYTCLYTNSQDLQFIVEAHPRHERVAYACGFSGIGYKFTSVIGEILADLAIAGETEHPIGFLSSSRFAAIGKAS